MSESDIRRILEAIARLETKVEGIGADNVRGEEVHKDHENRLRSLERVRWLIAGACLVAGGGTVTVVQQIIGG